MNLTSCTGCGVVFDKDQIEFPLDYYSIEEPDNENYNWSHSGGFVPAVPCPICQNLIKKEEL